jgi:hypothetical protein
MFSSGRRVVLGGCGDTGRGLWRRARHSDHLPPVAVSVATETDADGPGWLRRPPPHAAGHVPCVRGRGVSSPGPARRSGGGVRPAVVRWLRQRRARWYPPCGCRPGGRCSPDCRRRSWPAAAMPGPPASTISSTPKSAIMGVDNTRPGVGPGVAGVSSLGVTRCSSITPHHRAIPRHCNSSRRARV